MNSLAGDHTTQRMKIIGLAAAPAGGKSTVAKMLADLGAVWINADQLAHQVLQQPAVVEQLAGKLGASIQNADGSANRKQIAALVFGDDATSETRLRFLESVVHPRVRSEMEGQLADAQQSAAKVVVLDVPLLFESGWADRCDEIWFIDTPVETRQKVAGLRGWTPEQLADRELKQLDIREKRARSDRILRNHGTLQDLQTVVQNNWLDCGLGRR